jgi:hypothetical protein
MSVFDWYQVAADVIILGLMFGHSHRIIWRRR